MPDLPPWYTDPVDGVAIGDLVGNTPLLPARNLGRRLAIPNLYLKLEGSNPTGSHKDRIAFAHVRDAKEHGATGLVVATCGNYGTSCAYAGRLANLPCRIFIPLTYHTKRVAEMEALGAIVERAGRDYESAVAAASAWAATSGWYDANPGGKNTELQIRAYTSIGMEIRRQLGSQPAAVAAPVSNGTVLAGIHQGLSGGGNPPRLIAGSAARQNPIVAAFRNHLSSCEDLSPELIRETKTNEPLINWHSSDGDVVLHAIRTTGGFAADISDRRLIKAATLCRQLEGLMVLPSATAGLVALTQLKWDTTQPVVAVLTARR